MGESAIDIIVDDAALRTLPYWSEMGARGVPPHITVLYPWRPTPLDDDALAALAGAVRGIEPFTLTVGARIETFPIGVVYAAVEPADAWRRVAGAVWRAFPESAPYGGTFEQPVPHLTLAKCAPDELTGVQRAVMAEVGVMLPLVVEATALSVECEDDEGVWSIERTVSLGAR